MSNNHRLSILIRCRNEERLIGQTLEGIFSQAIDLPYEVVVVDSGSTDRTLEIVKAYKVTLYSIPPESFSFGYALNYAVSRAAGTIMVNLSAHCVPRDNYWLSALVKPIIDGIADATYGRQLPREGLNPFEEVSLRKHFPEAEKKNGRVPFSNANCAFSKRLWDEQRFDEESPSWEDFLWYTLLKDKYTFAYCPEAAVFHTHAFSLAAISRRSYIDGRAFALIKKKYGMDIIEGLHHGLRNKAIYFLSDIKGHLKVFLEKRYWKYVLMLPLVRFLAYRSYLKGLRSFR
jgi:rhamnosyltransferase